jgi:hypothetical protein
MSESEVVKFLGQILSILTYGGSSAVKTLNQASFNMGRVVRFEVKIPASVGEFPVDLCGLCRLISDDQNIQKGNCIARLRFHSEADGRP